MMNLMRRAFLAISAVLLASGHAHAVMISGFAQGTITSAMSGLDQPGGQVYRFTPGEGIFLSYSFDTSRSEPPLGGFSPDEQRYFVPPASFRLTTEGGYNGSGQSSQFTFGEARVTNGLSDRFTLLIGGPGGNIELVFSDPTGTVLSSTALPTLAEIGGFSRASVAFSRELRNGAESFRADLTPVVDASNFPVPEPSTFALGGIGLAILGLGRARRRRAWATA